MAYKEKILGGIQKIYGLLRNGFVQTIILITVCLLTYIVNDKEQRAKLILSNASLVESLKRQNEWEICTSNKTFVSLQYNCKDIIDKQPIRYAIEHSLSH